MDIAVLAVTRLSDGVCVAGVTREGKWVRPTRPAPQTWWPERLVLQQKDCIDETGRWVIRKGNVVDIDLREPIPAGFHSEDWLVGDRPPRLVRELPDETYCRVCSRFTEKSLRLLFLKAHPRSLITVRPEEVISFEFATETDGSDTPKYLPRITFESGAEYYSSKAVTDAEWRACGRSFIKKHGNPCCLDAGQAFAELGVADCWLTIGRYDIETTPYLLVIGVHLFPVRRFEMDFNRA